MGQVTTSITVSFGGDAANLHLSAEIDSRADGLNGGDTSFQPGDTAYFLVYKSSSVVLDNPIGSAGVINTQPDIDIDIEEFISFADTKTGSVSKPIKDGTLTTKWLGKDLGSLSIGSNGTTLNAGIKGVAVAKLNYKTTAKVFTINSPSVLNGETTYQLLIFVRGDG